MPWLDSAIIKMGTLPGSWMRWSRFPADLLKEALPGHSVGDEDMDDLASSFGVSSSVIRHQIANHNLAIPLPE